MATSLSKCLGLSLALSLLLACGAAAEGLPELRPDFGAPDEPARWQGRGVGNAMLRALREHLLLEGMTRIDCGCHRDNAGAWRFYERLGFRPLDEERLAWIL